MIDTLALILGIILICKKSDNLPKFYWGIIAALIGLVFIWENIGWVNIRTQNPVYEYRDILNIEKMVKFYILASIVSLYPLASLRPGHLTKFKVALYMIPPVMITTIGICYLLFNGNTTALDSISQIGSNLNQFDVKLRLTIFIFTIITPLIYFLGPLLGSSGQRKINNTMYAFIGFMFALLGIYILFTLFICDLFFNGFGIVSILFSIFFSIQYIRRESPLSDRIEAIKATNHPVFDEEKIEEATIETKNEPAVILPLFRSIDDYLKKNHDYTSSKFSLEILSKSIHESETNISHAIKSAGYSGFKEYVNKLRLEHFRHLALQDSHRTTKELWVKCGFPSKATFYRQFSLAYNETPREFIDKQNYTE